MNKKCEDCKRSCSGSHADGDDPCHVHFDGDMRLVDELRISISRKTAFKTAGMRLEETNLPQAIYTKDSGMYATMNKRAWWMMKPGELVCVMQRPSHNLRSVRKHG